MVTEESIQKWQSVWKQLLDMAYFQKNIKSSIFVQDSESEMLDLYVWSKSDPDFEKLTLDNMWKVYSSRLDSSNQFIEPQPVPELTDLYVSGMVFHSLGIGPFMKTCFPNCVVRFWED